MRCRILEQAHRASEEVHLRDRLGCMHVGVMKRPIFTERSLHEGYPYEISAETALLSDSNLNFAHGGERGELKVTQQELRTHLLLERLYQFNVEPDRRSHVPEAALQSFAARTGHVAVMEVVGVPVGRDERLRHQPAPRFCNGILRTSEARRGTTLGETKRPVTPVPGVDTQRISERQERKPINRKLCDLFVRQRTHTSSGHDGSTEREVVITVIRVLLATDTR